MCGALSKHKLVLEEETAAGMFSKQGKNMFTAGHFYLSLLAQLIKSFQINVLIAFLLSPVTTQPNMSEHRTPNWPKKIGNS